MAFETQLQPGATSPRGAIGSAVAMVSRGSWASLVCLAVVVTIMQVLQGLNADTSWLLTVAANWCGGGRPYLDILEFNPPAAVLSLMPALAIADLVGIRPETVVISLTSLAALVSIELSLALGAQSGHRQHPAAYRVISGFALFVMPVSIFAEREHLAVIALWPIWRAMQIRADRLTPRWSLILVAGLGATFAVALKPQFALMILLPAIGIGVLRRNARHVFQPEYGIAVGLVALYGLGVYLLIPAYTQTMLPLVSDYYLAVREPVAVLLRAPAMLWMVVALIGLAVIARGRLREPPLVLPLLAGLGGFIAVLQQAKGFSYHYYPIVAALFPALAGHAMVIANRRLTKTPTLERVPVVAGFLAVAAGLVGATLSFYAPVRPFYALVEPIAARYDHPKILAISRHIWVGHPLARDVNGIWVGSVSHQWITPGALYRLGLGGESPEMRLQRSAAIEADKARTAKDIATKKPDVILLERDEAVIPAWFASEDELRRFLTGYARLGSLYETVEVWARKR